MAFIITTKNGSKNFENKEFINIGAQNSCDYQLNLGFDFLLSVQYNPQNNSFVLLNPFNNPNFLFKGQPIGAKLEIDNMCKIMVKDSDEFITIKLAENVVYEPTKSSIASQDFTQADMAGLYGNEVNATTRIKLEKMQENIEAARTKIIKEVSFKINDLKKKISMNSKSGIFLHVALLFASLVCAFGVGNYLMGLPLKEAENIIQMPANLKLIGIYMIIIYGIGLVFKQGITLSLQNKLNENTGVLQIAEKFLIYIPTLFYISIYLINVLYYITPGTFPIFAVLISLFFTGSAMALALACGYFKSSSIENSKELEKYEYREDFERVTKEYQKWIEYYVNNLSSTKIKNIKEKMFNLQLKSMLEMILGFVTAPFLAYGVSNTLAMCFPEAAGWIRISGLRISPVFLGLATFMIIFAFFAFVNAFWCNKKVQASNVLKQDGFSNYLQHGVEIFGLEGIKRLSADSRKSLAIGLAIIFIEFSMNVSYFMQEIGGDLSGLFLSIIAALVPTALLIAETYMLSQTKFDIWVSEELIAKVDKE